MSATITIIKTAEMTPHQQALVAHYTDIEFGHVAAVQQHRWARPDWTVLVSDEHRLVSFLHLVERTARFDGQAVRLAGIHNVITPERHRGRGYARSALGAAVRFFFGDLGVDCGLLLCAETLVGYYERLGWQAVASKLLFDQPGGQTVWPHRVMLLPRSGPVGDRFAVEVIDLCGYPW